MAYGNLAFSDVRREDRDEVHYRARGTRAGGAALPLLVVNMSPHGFMARCEAEIAEGERLRITLPGVGTVTAEVRWALGGRIGCQLERPVPLGNYYELLAALTR